MEQLLEEWFVYTKEKLYADFLDLRERGSHGIGLHAFSQRLRVRRAPRSLMTLLDELNKTGEIVLTARVWPPTGLHVSREVVKLPLTEWLVLVTRSNKKVYFHYNTARWFDTAPDDEALAYDNFMLYITEYGLPMDVRARLASDLE